MKTEHKLTWRGAIMDAFLDRKIDHFPRFRNDGGKIESISNPAIIEQIENALANLKAKPEDLAACLDRGRETLNEVKQLTEYQDQKATRLLTIVTFLSALSGVLFSRLVESYPLWPIVRRYGVSVESGLGIAAYAAFGVFVLSAITGALVIFHATRSRFKYPEIDAEAPGRRRSRLGSYLFYRDLIELRPTRWANAFTVPDGSAIEPEMALRYLKNYIVESYLVAAKVADKLRYLEPAQGILAFSIRAILVWLVFSGLMIAIVPSENGAVSNVPTSSQMAPPGAGN